MNAIGRAQAMRPYRWHFNIFSVGFAILEYRVLADFFEVLAFGLLLQNLAQPIPTH
jgi:hypothetical protein